MLYYPGQGLVILEATGWDYGKSLEILQRRYGADAGSLKKSIVILDLSPYEEEYKRFWHENFSLGLFSPDHWRHILSSGWKNCFINILERISLFSRKKSLASLVNSEVQSKYFFLKLFEIQQITTFVHAIFRSFSNLVENFESIRKVFLREVIFCLFYSKFSASDTLRLKQMK